MFFIISGFPLFQYVCYTLTMYKSPNPVKEKKVAIVRSRMMEVLMPHYSHTQVQGRVIVVSVAIVPSNGKYRSCSVTGSRDRGVAQRQWRGTELLI